MKVKEQKQQPLTRKQLRAIEQELGVYLDKPEADLPGRNRSPNQCFVVYDEDEVQAGSVLASTKYFTEDELRTLLLELFE